MRIVYNGSELEIEEGITLLEHLSRENLSDKPGIAVAVNEAVIPRAAWPNAPLKPGDAVLVINATQGG